MPYHVTIQPSGHEFQVAENEAILDAALREKGSVLPYGCRNGTCGSCMGTIRSGEVRYPNGRPAGLSEQDQAEGKALLCQARPRSDLVIEAREVKTGDIAVKTLPCRVERRELLVPDVMRLYLKLPNTERLQFLAGQYIDILLADGRRRGFSLANPPHADEWLELHVRHVPGGFFTGFVFERFDGEDFGNAVRRAFALYRRKEAWRQVQRHAMTLDFGWENPARAYLALYRPLVEAAR